MKKIRPITVIPSELYVERAANKQLDDVIEHMGRPAYVLVSRQMGKTNLLLNMKRRREARGDIVCYFDLSVRFSSHRSLLRGVIDLIIESNLDILEVISEEIASQRNGLDVDPTREYDRHLRLILRIIGNRRLIIILDEVDSLTSASYSDAFFAQIRSMYFSRTNYNEYNRLTYALSGVAEPTDLIRDKEISPFNIGEKIYLDDFTPSECDSLLQKANLELPREVIEAVYEWCSGNPRMTWDVYSELEDLREAGVQLSKKDVQVVIEKLYLTRFDRAPIDHIRVLAESDPVIRNALIALKWGKSNTLDERTRGRLYLAGITRAGIGDATTIKNKVIDESLSEAWLESISVNVKTVLDAASEEFAKKRYDSAVRLVEEFLTSNDKASLPLDTRIQFGIALTHIGRFEEAIEQLEFALAAATAQTQKDLARYYLGTAFLKSGRPEEALIQFTEEIVQSDLSLAARLSRTSALISKGRRENLIAASKEALELCEEIIASGNINSSEMKEISTSGFYNQFAALIGINEEEKAVKALDRALDVAPASFRPALLLAKKNHVSAHYSHEIVREAASLVINNRLTFEPGSTAALKFNEKILTSILLDLIDEKDQSLFSDLLNYASSHLYAGVISDFSLLIRLARSAKESDVKSAVILLWYAVDYLSDESNSLSLTESALKELVLAEGARNEEAFSRYSDLISRKALGSHKMDDGDFGIFFTAAMEMIKDKRFSEALSLVEMTSSRASDSEDGVVFKIVMMHQKLTAQRGIKDSTGARLTAREIIDLIDKPSEYLTESDVKTAISFMRRDALEYYLSPANDPFRNYRRNEKIAVKDARTGQVTVEKFKNVADDLRSGKLIIVPKSR